MIEPGNRGRGSQLFLVYPPPPAVFCGNSTWGATGSNGLKQEKKEDVYEVNGNMRKTYLIAVFGLVALVATVGLVSAGYGPGFNDEEHQCVNFVDADGDGVCDNWVDADGDGMNDLRPLDGTGCQYRYGAGERQGSGYGPGDGSGYHEMGPRDSTGYGPETGDCINDE